MEGEVRGVIKKWTVGLTLDRYSQATIASREVATFYPNPPRAMVLQPIAHKFFDHLLIGVLLLMREKDEAVYARPDYRTVELPFY